MKGALCFVIAHLSSSPETRLGLIATGDPEVSMFSSNPGSLCLWLWSPGHHHLSVHNPEQETVISCVCFLSTLTWSLHCMDHRYVFSQNLHLLSYFFTRENVTNNRETASTKAVPNLKLSSASLALVLLGKVHVRTNPHASLVPRAINQSGPHLGLKGVLGKKGPHPVSSALMEVWEEAFTCTLHCFMALSCLILKYPSDEVTAE